MIRPYLEIADYIKPGDTHTVTEHLGKGHGGGFMASYLFISESYILIN